MDDAETLGCIGDPETTTTSISAPDAPTTTTVTSPPTTVPSSQLEGSLGGLRATVRIEPLDLEAAEILTVHITATDEDGGELALGVDWGDAPGGFPGPSILECRGGHDVELPASRQSWTLQHSYRRPGRYPIGVVVSAGYCDPEAGKTLKVPGVVAVGSGPLLSNGPGVPIVDAGPADEQSPGVFDLGIDAEDPDGWIHRIDVDWGDGSPPHKLEYSTSACVDDLSAFPGPTRRVEKLTHTYPDAGSYQVNVAVHSAGCKGADLQTVTELLTAVAP
ncbi:MAG: DUF4442 domain-containing protein [Actinomycetota bacterium]|nr:DUF4442 domain-containing protein [Actinomycetota bacterium]